MLADLKAICLAKRPIRPLVGRPQMIILSARKRFGLWLRKTYANYAKAPALCSERASVCISHMSSA